MLYTHNFNMSIFRRFLNQCRRHKIKVKITDYYANSMGGSRVYEYKGIITGYKTLDNPDSSEKTVKIFLKGNREITVDIQTDAWLDYSVNDFHINWVYSGPTCGVRFERCKKVHEKEKSC